MRHLRRKVSSSGPASAAIANAVAIALSIGLLPAWPLLASAGERAPQRTAAQAVEDLGTGPPLSAEARQLVDWIVLTGDHAGAAFIVVDKPHASVFVFDAGARLRAHSAVLLGAALGDHSVPGIGSRPMAQILPAERTTPAGRFVAERGRNLHGEDIVWVDYEAAISMHRVRNSNPAERRAERLATPAIDDNRISYGCINVPVAFYERYIQPVFALRTAVVYVLPDVMPVGEVFGLSRAVSSTADREGALAAQVQAQRGNVVRVDRGRAGAD